MTSDLDFIRDELHSIRNASDTVFRNDKEACAFLGVSLTFFQKHYKPYCGVKQGNSMTYLKSELLARREQLRHELGGE